MRCPECGSRSVGRVGAEQYYCWDCCVEFRVVRGEVRVFYLDPDGELTAAGPPLLSQRGRSRRGQEPGGEAQAAPPPPAARRPPVA
ncbi:MAG: hypothetical protein L6E13_10885 [Firmicutes bacterium]|nr:hypothetical protein [Bacillota bacterium]